MDNMIKVGTKIMYSAKFLRSIGEYTGERPFMKGTVRDINDLGSLKVALIEWDDHKASSVNIKNLSIIAADGVVIDVD